MTIPTTTAEAPRIAPTAVVIAENVRKTVELPPAFLASIARRGVRTPVLLRLDELGHYNVIDGQRRVLAAIEAGHKDIPYVLLTDVAEGPDRIIEQLDANHHRDPMTDADDAHAFEQLRLFGMSADDIAVALSRPKNVIEAALKVVDAPHREALLASEFDLLTSAQIADVAGDDLQVLEEISAEVQDQGVERLEHILEWARRELACRRARAEKTEELTSQGITVLDETPHYDDRSVAQLHELADAAGGVLEEETHTSCPGHAVYVRARWDATTYTSVYCTQWATYHRKRTSGGASKPAPGSEEASAERKRVVASNKASDVAVAVRRKWMKQILEARKLPDGALEHAAAMIARYGTELSYTQAGVDGDPLTAIWPIDKRTILARDAVTKVDATRALLAHAFAVGEAGLPRDFWRQNPTRVSYARAAAGASEPSAGARHLKALASFGYSLSEVEETWLTVAPDGH